MKLETAKELKRVADEYGVELPYYCDVFVEAHYPETGEGVYPKYTTDELLKWLPIEIRNALRWIGNNEAPFALDLAGEYTIFEKEEPSEALALLAIELIKNGIIK